MPPKCFNCSSKNGLHMLPATIEFKMLWLDVIPNVQLTDFETSSFRLCTLHFEDNFLTTGKRLTRNAIPSKFMTEKGIWYSIKYVETSKSDHNDEKLPDNSENLSNVPPTGSFTSTPKSPPIPISSKFPTMLENVNRQFKQNRHDVDCTPTTSKRKLVNIKKDLYKNRNFNKTLIKKYKHLKTKNEMKETY